MTFAVHHLISKRPSERAKDNNDATGSACQDNYRRPSRRPHDGHGYWNAIPVHPIQHFAQLTFSSIPICLWIALGLSLSLPLIVRVIKFFRRCVWATPVFPILVKPVLEIPIIVAVPLIAARTATRSWGPCATAAATATSAPAGTAAASTAA